MARAPRTSARLSTCRVHGFAHWHGLPCPVCESGVEPIAASDPFGEPLRFWGATILGAFAFGGVLALVFRGGAHLIGGA